MRTNWECEYVGVVSVCSVCVWGFWQIVCYIMRAEKQEVVAGGGGGQVSPKTRRDFGDYYIQACHSFYCLFL